MDSADRIEAAKKLYAAHTNNNPVIHCNRFPSWDELSLKQKVEWIEKTRLPTTPIEQSGLEERFRDPSAVASHTTLTDPEYCSDEDGNPLWRCEIDSGAGQATVAEVYGSTEAEARARGEAIAAALRDTALTADKARDEALEEAGFDYVLPEGASLEEWRENVLGTELYQRGDTVLVWVNEADLNPFRSLKGAAK